MSEQDQPAGTERPADEDTLRALLSSMEPVLTSEDVLHVLHIAAGPLDPSESGTGQMLASMIAADCGWPEQPIPAWLEETVKKVLALTDEQAEKLTAICNTHWSTRNLEDE